VELLELPDTMRLGKLYGISAFFAMVVGFGLTGCKPAKNPEESGDPGAAVGPVESAPGVYRLVMEVGDNMKFPITRFQLPAGCTFTLEFRHTGGMSLEQMGHNWVLLKPGTLVNSFVGEASGAVDSGYIPENWEDAIVAHTGLLGGGDFETLTFTIPEEPGEYPYVCTFPGHFFAGMKGMLEVY
jgi:azurin